MGGANSTLLPSSPSTSNKPTTIITSNLNNASTSQPTFDQILRFIEPIYYWFEPLTTEEKEKLISNWKIIINNNSQEFERIKNEIPESAEFSSLTEYFASRFYSRFIEIHPISKSMFSKNSSKQGRLFMNLITLIVGAEEEGTDDSIRRILIALVKSHNPMGVRSVEYSIFGECLFWTLKAILGPIHYDNIANRAWIKLYSKMLSIILPQAVKYELDNREALEKMKFSRLQVDSPQQAVPAAESPISLKTDEHRVSTAANSSEE